MLSPVGCCCAHLLTDICMPMDTLQGVAAAATGQTLHPPSPSSSSDVQAVQDEIEEVKQQTKDLEKKIVGLEAEIEEAKKQGEKEEVTQLRAEKQQLRAEKQQLRAEKQQLGEKQLLLLRANTRNSN